MAANLLDASVGHPVARQLQPGVLGARSGRVGEGLRGLGVVDRQADGGTVVTIAAMGCQRSIAAKIVEKKADYILAVKENQGHRLEEIEDSFQMLAADAVAEEIDCGHGRVERRRYSVIADLSLLEKASEWASLQGLVRIQAERCHPPRRATGKKLKAGWDNDYLLPLLRN